MCRIAGSLGASVRARPIGPPAGRISDSRLADAFADHAEFFQVEDLVVVAGRGAGEDLVEKFLRSPTLETRDQMEDLQSASRGTGLIVATARIAIAMIKQSVFPLINTSSATSGVT